MTSSNHYQPEERQLHMQTLSPVSPKPVAFPQPSNIPILNNQMDSTMNENSTYSVTPSQTPANFKDAPENGYTIGADSETAQTQMGALETTDSRGQQYEAGTIKQEYPSAEQQSPMKEGSGEATDKALAGDEVEEEYRPAQSYDTFDEAARDANLDQAQVAEAKQQEELARAGDEQKSPVQQDAMDIQALLDNIVNNASSFSAQIPDAGTIAASRSSTDTTPLRIVPAANLPPRPPTQVNGTSDAALRAMHGFAQNAATSQHLPGPPGTEQPLLAYPPPPMPNTGAPGTDSAAAGLSAPPSATFQTRSTSVPQGKQQSTSMFNSQASESVDQNVDDEEDDRKWDSEIQKKYDEFLDQERMYVMKGEWEKFPANSRLFIGNLPTEKVTKRDLFHVFHKYGPLAQVSIKQAYGFVQFLIAQDCLRALETEQSVPIRGRKIHLEISKPQRNKTSGGRDSRQRRSRSPENRGGGIDRYRSGENRRQRSPSPRSRAKYGRRRSRSRSPQFGRRPEAAPSDHDDDCPLPRRPPQDVPDIQIIAKDSPDRNFISYVERAFEARGIKVNVLLLSPKLPEASVMRRQILEGVLAVTKLDRNVQMANKFHLSVFDRSQGASNVRFEEYANLDLNICVELVLRAKQNARPAIPQYGNTNPGPYGLPMIPPPQQQTPYHSPPSQQPLQQHYYGQPPTQPPPQSQYSGYDPNIIQGLISRVQQQTPQQTQPAYTPQPGMPQQQQQPDIARLLASVGGGQSQSYPPQQQQQSSLPPSLQALLGNAQQQPPPQSYGQYQQQQPPQQQYQQPQQTPAQPDMKNIMAGLARWKG